MRMGMPSISSALPATSLSEENTHRDFAQLIKPTAADTSPLSFPDVKIGTANRPIPFPELKMDLGVRVATHNRV